MGEITGQCLCGAIGYEMAKPPARTTICYCKFCQRATGTAQMILPVAPLADFTITRGSPAVYTHISEGSGKEVYVHFCDKCGTKLYMTYERWPDMMGLYSGTLDNPDIVSLDPETAKQIFVSSARPGTILYPGIPAFLEHATNLEGKPQQSVTLKGPKAVEELRHTAWS